MRPALEYLLRAANEFLGANTIGDALRLDLGHLAKLTGIATDLDALAIRQLTGSSSIVDEFIRSVAGLMESMSETERLIVDLRLFAEPPQTLEEIGQRVGISRERVRQLQVRTNDTIGSILTPAIKRVAPVIRQQFGPVLRRGDLHARVAAIFGRSDEPAADLARRMLIVQLGYSDVASIYLDDDAVAVVETLRNAARTASDDVGLVDEGLLRGALPDERWVRYWDELVECCDLSRLSGHLALRDTTRARVKATLLHIGRPATRRRSLRSPDWTPTASEISSRSSLAWRRRQEPMGACRVDR